MPGSCQYGKGSTVDHAAAALTGTSNDRHVMEPLRMVGSRPAGPVGGVLVGLVAGGLVCAAWVNDLLLGVAVGGIIAALAVCMVWAVPEWHRFGVGMLAGAVVGTVVAAVGWSLVR
jgi:hypothetical protein